MESPKLLNCLAYALRFWKQYPRYRIYYNGCHVINSDYELHDPKYLFKGWYMPIEVDGYDYFKRTWVDKDNLLNEEEQQLLREYFNIK